MRNFGAALALIAALFATNSPAAADILVDNVAGLTLDETGAVETFSAVLVGTDGRIVEVLNDKSKRPGKVEYRIDGEGRVMIPGLIDSHANAMELGLALLKAKAGFEGDPQGEPRPEDRDLAFAEAQDLFLKAGITTVADIGTTIEDWQSYRRSGDRGALRIRLVAYAEGVEDMALIGGPGPTPWLYEGRLQQNGVVITLDGPLETRSAWLKTPYADSPSETGRPLTNEVRLKNMMSRAAIDNFQIAVRAHGNAGVSATLDAFDELSKTYKGDRRWRIEGANVIDSVDAQRIGQAGIFASMQPGRLGIESATAPQLLGPERLAQVQRWRSLSDSGARLVFGSGTRGEAPRPFALMALAMSRRTGSDAPFGGWQPQERISREEALAAFTTGASQALFANGRLGRIAPGLAADFLFIDRDPLLASPEQLAETQVLETWISGVKVYDASDAGGRDIGRAAIESFGR